MVSEEVLVCLRLDSLLDDLRGVKSHQCLKVVEFLLDLLLKILSLLQNVMGKDQNLVEHLLLSKGTLNQVNEVVNGGYATHVCICANCRTLFFLLLSSKPIRIVLINLINFSAHSLLLYITYR